MAGGKKRFSGVIPNLMILGLCLLIWTIGERAPRGDQQQRDELVLDEVPVADEQVILQKMAVLQRVAGFENRGYISSAPEVDALYLAFVVQDRQLETSGANVLLGNASAPETLELPDQRSQCSVAVEGNWSVLLFQGAASSMTSAGQQIPQCLGYYWPEGRPVIVSFAVVAAGVERQQLTGLMLQLQPEMLQSMPASPDDGLRQLPGSLGHLAINLYALDNRLETDLFNPVLAEKFAGIFNPQLTRIDPEVFQQTKQRLVNRLLHRLDKPASLAPILAVYAAAGENPAEINSVVDRINALTLAQYQEILLTLFPEHPDGNRPASQQFASNRR